MSSPFQPSWARPSRILLTTHRLTLKVFTNAYFHLNQAVVVITLKEFMHIQTAYFTLGNLLCMTASAKCLKYRWRDPVCSMIDDATRETDEDKHRYRQRQTESEPGESWTRSSHRGPGDRQTVSPCLTALMTGSKLIQQDKQITETNLSRHLPSHTHTHTRTHAHTLEVL